MTNMYNLLPLYKITKLVHILTLVSNTNANIYAKTHQYDINE